MPTGSNYNVAVVIVNRHEPENEVAGRLLEIADEKGYDARVVEAQRGDHDAALSFRVPEDVAEQFNADRSDRWSADKIENDDEKADDLAAASVNGDAYAADAVRRAQSARAKNAANKAADEEARQNSTDDDKSTHPARTSRPGKARE